MRTMARMAKSRIMMDSGSHGGAVDHTLESESDSSSPLNTNKHKFFLAI